MTVSLLSTVDKAASCSLRWNRVSKLAIECRNLEDIQEACSEFLKIKSFIKCNNSKLQDENPNVYYICIMASVAQTYTVLRS